MKKLKVTAPKAVAWATKKAALLKERGARRILVVYDGPNARVYQEQRSKP